MASTELRINMARISGRKGGHWWSTMYKVQSILINQGCLKGWHFFHNHYHYKLRKAQMPCLLGTWFANRIRHQMSTNWKLKWKHFLLLAEWRKYLFWQTKWTSCYGWAAAAAAAEPWVSRQNPGWEKKTICTWPSNRSWTSYVSRRATQPTGLPGQSRTA